jgi:hypothetical protein
MCERVDLGNGQFAIVCGRRRSHRRAQVGASEAKKLKLPATLEELKRAGWKWVTSRECKLCHTPLQFWRTTAGKLMPLEASMAEGVWILLSHWATCVFADKFRKPAPKPVVPEKQGDLFS